MSAVFTPSHGSKAPAKGIDFEDLKSKAMGKGFKPVYIDRMREQAVMAFMFSQPSMASPSVDEIRIGVSRAFNANLSSVGGFSEAYQRERLVVKTIGRQLPERKFDETLKMMSALIHRLDASKIGPACVLENAKHRFCALVGETAEAYKVFNMDSKELLRRVEAEPILVKHGVAAKVKELLSGPTPAKTTLGGLIGRVTGYTAPRPGRSSGTHV